MANRVIATVISIALMAYMCNAVQGNITPLAKSGTFYERLIHDIINEARGHRKKTAETLYKWIEKYKDDLQKHNALQPEQEVSKNSSPGKRHMIQEDFQNALSSLIKNHTAILSALRDSEDETDSSSAETVDQEVYNNKNKVQAEDNNCLESGESNSQDQSSESSDSKESDDSTVQSVMHDTIRMMRDLRSRAIERIIEGQHFVKSQLRSKFDMLSKALAADKDNDYDESYDKDYDDSGKIKSAETIPEDVNELNKFIKNELDRNKEKGNETDVHSALVKRICDILKSDIKNLQLSKQSFIAAKEEVAKAAKKLHEKSHRDHNRSRGHSEKRTFDFQSLISFKSKVGKMVLKKKEYINQIVLFKRKIKETLKGLFLNYPKTNPSAYTFSSKEFNNTSKNLFTATPGYFRRTTDKSKLAANASITNFDRDNESKLTTNNTSNYENDDDENLQNNGQAGEQIDTSFNTSHIDELKLAAGYTGTNDEADNKGNSVVVVVVVLACLIICAIVGILSVVMWRKYHSHRLYVRIPNGSSSFSA